MMRYGAAPRAVPPSRTPDQAVVGVYGPAMQLSNDFTYQSFFDSTLLQNGILTQAPNSLIVSSTKKSENVKGYGVFIHPSSEAPVGIDFRNGAPVIYGKPGQIIRPVGPRPDKPTHFEGFDWGLPFGWLGGGLVNLVVLQSPTADVWAPGNPEVIFHRARFKVNQPADLSNAGTNNAPNNWPRRFPWINAIRKSGANVFPQKGKPILSISDCDRVLLVLRDKTGGGNFPLGAAANIRVIYQSTTDIDMTSTGTFGQVSSPFEDIQFPSWTNVGTSGNLNLQNPALWVTPSSATGSGLLRFNGDSGGIVFVDLTAGAALNGCFIDVVRYGRL